MKSKFFNVSLINVYAPTEDEDDSVKDEFHCGFKSVFESLPLKVIPDDLNGG